MTWLKMIQKVEGKKRGTKIYNLLKEIDPKIEKWNQNIWEQTIFVYPNEVVIDKYYDHSEIIRVKRD